ncbi:MAG TPA: hypothetical protein VIH21_11355 [Dehalococcoidia bacterium]|jgi:hypothetical protein
MTDNWLLTEMIAEQKRHALDALSPHLIEAARIEQERHRGLRATVASALVSMALHLDDKAAPRTAAITR